ncbi:mucin-1 [Streptomyces sp. NPDC093591]|uniref:mucin-1 n=1 Tax=Streptomyces sp. NPDC093591 TaxID=3366044 RepID=UPI00381BCBCC
MRYAPPGLCLNDFDLITVEDGYIALHLQGPWTRRFDHTHMETSYGRAFSTDLVTWEPLGPGFGVGAPGRFDDTAVWTMHVFPAEGRTAMAYTGVTERGWLDQTIGLAWSDRAEGTGWRRARPDEPVVRADPRWYRVEGAHQAWRDPFVVRDDENPGWLMVICASDARLPAERSGCVAFATSDDLLNWTVHPPLISPGDIDQLECPVLERTANGWLLLGCNHGDYTFEAWEAPRLRGPWTRVGRVAPPGSYAPRVTTAPDRRRVVLHTVPRRVGLTDAGARCRGMLAQPKLLANDADHGWHLRWWDGLDPWIGPDVTHTGEPVLNAVTDIDCAGGDMDVLLRERDAGEPVVLRLRGQEISLANATGGPHLRHLPCPVRELRVLTVGEYIEVYADGVHVLNASTYSGRSTVIRRHGRAGADGLRVRRLLLPDPLRDDASAVWRAPEPR